MLGARHSTIALDIGAVSVRVLQLRRAASQIVPSCVCLVNNRLHASPAPDTSGSLAVQRATRVVQQLELVGRAASVAAWPPDVSFHLLQVPNEMFAAAQAEWNTMLRFEAARMGKGTPDEFEVAAWPLPGRGVGGANVMLAFTLRARAAAWRSLVAHMGLELQRIDLAPLALVRAAWRAGVPGAPSNPREALWGVLELGALNCCLTIAVGNQCIFVRSLNLGGDSFTRAIVDSLELDYAAAETMKVDEELNLLNSPCQRHGSSDAGDDGGAVVLQQDQVALALASIRTRTRALTAELRRAFTYAMESYADAAPVGLYLTGGGANLRGLSEHLNESLGIPALRLTPRMVLGRERLAALGMRELDDASLTVATGLALGDLT